MNIRSLSCCAILALLSLGQVAAETPTACDDADGLQFLCGPINAEDLVWLGDSGLLLASSMADADGVGRMYLVDPSKMEYQEIYPANAANSLDSDQFPDCPGAPDPATFSSHGLAITALGNERYRLYATAHGERESVEVFEVDHTGDEPQITWQGCVLIPEGNSINSVAPLPDGGFLTTRISGTDENSFAAIFAGEVSGFLYEWHPGGALTELAGTEMSGPNGIDLSPDGRSVFVASWGRGEVARFERSDDGRITHDRTVAVNFRVDNLRFTSTGTILLAGHRLADNQDCGLPFCFSEWEVAEMDPATMEFTTLAVHAPRPDFLGATVAVRGAGGLWLGTFHGTRMVFIDED